MIDLAVIGGSGLYDLPGLEVVARHRIDTPFGRPSDAIVEGRLGERRVLFLARHGEGHVLTPTEVPFAANVYALKQLGAPRILSISAVGSLQEPYAPGSLVFPDQFVDRTTQRRQTFFGNGIVGHVSMADPTCPALRELAAELAQELDTTVYEGGTYVCIEGPQFGTRAESELYRSWGCDVVGMTNATEARLAREAGLCYATACFVTDYDCWKVDEEPVSLEQVLAVLHANADRGRRLVRLVLEALDRIASCGCAEANRHAVVTAPERRPPAVLRRLSVVLDPIPDDPRLTR